MVKGGLQEENGNWHENQKRGGGGGGLKRVTSFKSVRKILKMHAPPKQMVPA